MISGTSFVSKVLVVQMLLSLLSRKGSVRVVRAFTQAPSTRRVLALGPTAVQQQHQQRFLSASVEEDLDTAISDFLEDGKSSSKKKLADVVPRRGEAGFQEVNLDDLLQDSSEVCSALLL